MGRMGEIFFVGAGRREGGWSAVELIELKGGSNASIEDL